MLYDSFRINIAQLDSNVYRRFQYEQPSKRNTYCETNTFLPESSKICIVLSIGWSMSNVIHIATQYIAIMHVSIRIAPINMFCLRIPV